MVNSAKEWRDEITGSFSAGTLSLILTSLTSREVNSITDAIRTTPLPSPLILFELTGPSTTPSKPEGRPPTHSFTPSLLVYTITHSFTPSLAHLHHHSLIYTITHSFTPSLIYTITHLHHHALTPSLTHSALPYTITHSHPLLSQFTFLTIADQRWGPRWCG